MVENLQTQEMNKITATQAERPDMLPETHKDTTWCHKILKHAKTSTHTGAVKKPQEEDGEISLSSVLMTDPADV